MMSTVVIKHQESPDLVRVFCKGAPDILFNKSIRRINLEGNIVELTEDERISIYKEFVTERIYKRGLKGIAIGYKDLTN